MEEERYEGDLPRLRASAVERVAIPIPLRGEGASPSPARRTGGEFRCSGTSTIVTKPSTFTEATPRSECCETAPGLDSPKRARRCASAKRFLSSSVYEARDWVLGTNEGHWFALISIGGFLLALGTFCWHLAGGNDEYDASLNDSFWISWGLFFDPGTQTGLPASDPARVRIVAVAFSVCGFIFNLTLLGTVVEVVRGILRHYKEMYSRVSASDHVLVLGWSEKTLLLITELLAEEEKAAEPRRCCRRHCPARLRLCRKPRREVVILAERPVVDMRQDVRMHLHFEGINAHDISFREGNPTDRTELMKVCAQNAEDILIMGSGQNARSSDQQIIQTLLALGSLPGISQLKGDVFAEMQSQQSVNVVRTILPSAEGIIGRHMVDRMMVLRAIVPSVGFAYLELVSFRRGNELYIAAAPRQILGTPLRDACPLFPDAVICGVIPEPSPLGSCFATELITDSDYILEPGDQLLAVARNITAASTCRPLPGSSRSSTPRPPQTPPPMLARAGVPPTAIEQEDGQLLLGPLAAGPKVVLLLGCPPDFPNILEALDCYSARGSEVHILSLKPLEWREETLSRYFGPGGRTTERDDHFRRITVHHHIGMPTCPHDLAALNLSAASSVLVLAEQSSEGEAPLATDSENLTAVVALRSQLTATRGAKKCKVVTELLDSKTSQFLERNNNVRQLGSFVYSNAVSTGVFAMASTDKAVYNILKELLEPESTLGHIAAVPVRDFVRGTEELSFYDLHSRVWDACNGILLGWRRMSVRYPELNPKDKATRAIWTDVTGDELIMLRPKRTPLTPTPHSSVPNGSAESAKPGDHLPGSVVPG